MFIKVRYGDDQTMFVNPNCSIRLIYQYIRLKANVHAQYELDLCDEGGSLKRIYSYPPTAFGLEFLTQRATYFLIIHGRTNDGGLTKPYPLLSKSNKIYKDILSKLRKPSSKPCTRKKSRDRSSKKCST